MFIVTRGRRSLQVTFFGVRGSTPCPVGPTARYGGNTSCVVIDIEGRRPIVLDLGTGLRTWGETQPLNGSFAATALVSHFHFDHVQGLPFLSAADRVGARLDIYGPGQSGHDVADLCEGFIKPPYFPVALNQLRGKYQTIDVWNDSFQLGAAKVMVRPVPHVGLTVGYRVEADGRSVAYVPDHQAPQGLDSIADSVLELCDGVDLVIHDAQYTPVDWETKSHWGHCTTGYALEVAAQSGAKALALFHHDPSRTDADLDRLAAETRLLGRGRGVEVFAAAEGIRVVPGRSVLGQIGKCVSIGPMFKGR